MHTVSSLQRAAGALDEYNDCSVRALAVVTDRSYVPVHAVLALYGRKHGEGADPDQLRRAAARMGFVLHNVRAEYPGRTIRTVRRQLRWHHRYLVDTAHHVAGWDGEQLVDPEPDSLRRVTAIYLVTPAPLRRKKN